MLSWTFLWQLLGLISQCFVSVYPTPDVTSICGPETNQTLAQRIQSSQWKAADWLLDQQMEDWGWDFVSTGSAILSLQLANETWNNDLESMEAQLTMKQLNIEIMHEMLHKQHFKEMSLGKLAYYAMALHSTCHNVTDFHGHNIMRQLHHRVDNLIANQTNNYFPYSLALLALCSSGSEVPHSAIATLEEVQGQDGCFPFGVDVTSMAVMAMACMHDSFNSADRLTRLRNMMRKGARCIMGHETSDGGFGNSNRMNVISTALAVQALIAAGEDPSLWQCEEALYHILNAQDEDGHFGSQGGTIQILPLLSNRHHGSLSDIQRQCPATDMMQSIPLIGRRDEAIAVNFEISQELENSVVLFNPFVVDVLPGENLYRAMERARQIGYFSFESKLTQFGNHIITINNVTNDNANGLYWFIYIVDANGDQVSASTGADGIVPVDGALYRWIYRAYVPH